MAQADKINQAFDQAQPWVIAKGLSEASAEKQGSVARYLLARPCRQGLISTVSTCTLPVLAERVAKELFGLDRTFIWDDASVLPTSIAPFKHLMQRVEEKHLRQLVESAEAPAAPEEHRRK